MSFTSTSLSGATSTGPGSSFAFDLPKSKVTMQWFGGGTSGNVWLQLSLDGTNFVDVLNGTGDGGIITVDSHVAIAARARLANLSGGASVTAIIGIKPDEE